MQKSPPMLVCVQGLTKKSAMPAHLPLPVGISDYRLASTEYYYVDKTLMIKDFLEQRPMVSLFTRPRRFGKTLNMDMLRVFFEKTEEDTSKYFTNKAIWACGQKYRDYQGKYPVIFLTFKDVKRNTWEETYAHLTRLIGEEYLRHADLADSPACNDFEKAVYQRIVSSTADSTAAESTSTAASTEATAESTDEPVTIRITWWGGQTRHDLTQQVLDLYTSEHPNVTFEAVPSGWDGYFEKLATDTATGQRQYHQNGDEM